MKKTQKRLLTVALTAAIVGGIAQVQPAQAAGGQIPPDNRVVEAQFEKTVTVPNSIHVTLQDENGQALKGGEFQLLDENGKVTATWNGSQKYVVPETSQSFDGSSFAIKASELFETGDYAGRIRVFRQGMSDLSYDPDGYIQIPYEEQMRYVSYGERMTDKKTVTIPAGQIWLNVGQGYRRAEGQDLCVQNLILEGTEYDLSDLAGSITKLNAPAGAEVPEKFHIVLGSAGTSGTFQNMVLSGVQPEEYVEVELDLSAYYPQRIDADGKCRYGNTTYTFGAPVYNSESFVTSAYIIINSGAVSNVVSLTDGPTAKIYVKKGDYVPHVSCDFAYMREVSFGGGNGQDNVEMPIYDYAKHTIRAVAPAEQGVTVGYIPAGTYTLHQTAAPDGYELAKDQQITVKDSSKPEDLQKIVLVNQKEDGHEHTYSDQWSKDSDGHWHAATCEHTDLFKDKSAHTYGQWNVIKEATTETEGLQERECTVCGFIQQEKVDKLPPEVDPEIPPEQSETPTEEPEPTVKETTETTVPDTEQKPDTPKTGDASQLVLWAAGMMTSGAAAGTALLLKKKKR